MRLEGARPQGFGRGFGAVQAGVTDGNSWARNTAAAKRLPQASRELVERPRICRKPAPPGATGCPSAAARKRMEALGGPEKQVQRRRGQQKRCFRRHRAVARAVTACWPLPRPPLAGEAVVAIGVQRMNPRHRLTSDVTAKPSRQVG